MLPSERSRERLNLFPDYRRPPGARSARARTFSDVAALLLLFVLLNVARYNGRRVLKIQRSPAEFINAAYGQYERGAKIIVVYNAYTRGVSEYIREYVCV